MTPTAKPHERDLVEGVLNPLPLLVDILDREGRIAWANQSLVEFLKTDLPHLVGRNYEDLYSETSIPKIRSLLETSTPSEASFVVWLRTGKGHDTPLLAVAHRLPDDCIAILKVPVEGGSVEIDQELRERVEILTDMIGSASDACWCIEFLQPVDVTGSEDEIVDAVFGNAQRWRACNEAMARLYLLPKGLDFNDQPVSRYFPRSSINEDMVRQLVRSGYRLDRASAIDHRHDGSAMVVENDFRAAIKGDQLVRLWGTVRDIGPARRREEQLRERADTMLELLSVAPDPILMLAEDGLVMAANPAVEAAWGWPIEDLLGRSIEDILDFERLIAVADASSPGEVDIEVTNARSKRETWRLRVSDTDGTPRRFVITGRAAPLRRRLKTKEVAQ